MMSDKEIKDLQEWLEHRYSPEEKAWREANK